MFTSTGQRLDATGLYFYNARYYDAFLGRFISPDSVSPDLFKPQSLNKYSYCFNNPLKYNDPTGNWPNWADIGNAIKSGFQASVNAVKQNIDVIQTVLDVAGMIPVVGEAFDAVNGIIYAARGDYGNAALSLAACVPIFGTAATGVKLGAKVVDQVASTIKGVDKGIGNTGNIGENLLKNLGGESQKYFSTSIGARYVDQLVDGVAHESKVGYTSLSVSVQKQIAKDVELIDKGKIQGAVWHFYLSPITNKGGPSSNLAYALQNAGIEYIPPFSN